MVFEQGITVEWEEAWTVRHTFALQDAIVFVNSRRADLEKLPLTATVEEVLGALGDIDLEDALAELDVSASGASVVRTIVAVEPRPAADLRGRT